MGRMTQIAEALEAVKPTAQDVLGDSVTFSPIRWKTGWPHHLRRVPPFRDDASASITRSEVFAFAADVVESGYAREQIIDFLGACFAYVAGQSNQVMQMQAFLRNKGKASQLLTAVRKLDGAGAVDEGGQAVQLRRGARVQGERLDELQLVVRAVLGLRDEAPQPVGRRDPHGLGLVLGQVQADRRRELAQQRLHHGGVPLVADVGEDEVDEPGGGGLAVAHGVPGRPPQQRARQ